MAGYIRADSGNNIDNGNIIDATYLDAEFDAIQAAFHVSTGHNHDGTTGEGAPILAIGPAQDFVASATEFKAKTHNTYDLGTTGVRFKNAFFQGDVTTSGTTTSDEFKASSSGGVADPSYNWSDDNTTGMYRISAGTMGFTSAGVLAMVVDSGGVTANGIPFLGNLTGNVTGNVSGNAGGSAASLTTPRTFAISTGATGTATSFDGTANITIPVTSLDASYLLSGTVASARIAGSYTGITGTGALNAGSITSGFGQIDVGADDIYGAFFYSNAAGSTSFPNVSRASDPDTGMLFDGANILALVTGGTRRLTIDASAATFAPVIYAPNGSAPLPSLSFTSDSNTGFYSHTPNVIGIATGGSLTAMIDAVGVGVDLGSAAAPTFHFGAGGDGDTGFYRASSGSIGFTGNGSITARLFNDGDMTLEGVLTENSDERKKTNITPLTGALDVVKALQGVNYDWIKNGEPDTGLIAQAVEQVAPQLVKTDEDGWKSVKYTKLIAYLIEAVKELEQRI